MTIYHGYTKETPRNEQIKNEISFIKEQQANGNHFYDNRLLQLEIERESRLVSEWLDDVEAEPSKDEITSALWGIDMDTPHGVRFSFPQICNAMDEHEAAGRAAPDWMMRAYRDMQTLPAPIAVNVPSFVGVVYHV